MKDLGEYHIHVSVDAHGGLFFKLSNPASGSKIEEFKEIMESKFRRNRENMRLIFEDEWHARRLEFTVC